MYGKPMCSKPGHSWQGPFLFFVHVPFVKHVFLQVLMQTKCLSGCLFCTTNICVTKRSIPLQAHRSHQMSIQSYFKRECSVNNSRLGELVNGSTSIQALHILVAALRRSFARIFRFLLIALPECLKSQLH